MRRDKLEDFIRNNRDAFDDKIPSEKAWINIEQSLFSKNNWWQSLTLWRAAAVFFMILSVLLLLPKQSIGIKHEAALKEFKDVEAFYTKQISEKVQLIDQFQSREAGSYPNGFTHDFRQLEAMYFVLKEEMKNRPSQKVKDALVLNLLVRIDLLNQQLQKLEDLENSGTSEKAQRKRNI